MAASSATQAVPLLHASHPGPHRWPGRVDLRCMHGDKEDWTDRTVIVPAVYREWHGKAPPAWLSAQYPVYLYQRENASLPCMCPNRGYESGVYFTFIAQLYNQLPAFTAFIQADWIFLTKTNGGHGFQFWQPRCCEQGAGRPWSDYMPLGGRRSVWPPRCVFRSTAVYAKWVGRRNGALVEACLRELLRVLGVPVAVRPYNRSRPLNVTFYTNMNFVVSRRRIRYYTHTAWRALATRFIDEGVCLPQTVATAAPNGGAVAGAPARGALPAASYASGYGGDVPDVEDAARHAKYTLGMATEIISQTIFNFNPLEEGPAPQVPSDHECERQASTSCAHSNP